MNTIKKIERLELSWITGEGCEWINRSFDIEYQDSIEITQKLKQLVSAYYESTKNEACGLVDHWNRHGEDVYFGMFGSMKERENELILYGILNEYDDFESEKSFDK